ncbi:hypothetical protein JCGZ_15362 [Jatropha curcas]|uniref:Uncharacterized protein n=1 Tax=Jatropha curcas TaxID=180498 RepID=A0A067KHD4_JATCU|nr:hypothetical protein JCGZ_15362 [Jatropha curcas]
MMVDYEVDQGNQIKVLQADQTEPRSLQVNSKSFRPIRPSLGGDFKANQTALWSCSQNLLEPTKPIKLSFGSDQMIKSTQNPSSQSD